MTTTLKQFNAFWRQFKASNLLLSVCYFLSSSLFSVRLSGPLCPLFNTLRPRQNGRRFADDVFKCIFLNENAWILLKISLKFVPKVPINNMPALVQILAWRRSGDKPLSEPMMVNLLTHICVTRLQWVKGFNDSDCNWNEIHQWMLLVAIALLWNCPQMNATVPYWW